MDIITYALCKKADKEIIDMIHDMEGMTVQIVDEIPTVQEAQYNVMYLVDTNGDGKYEAYIKAKISGVDQIISLGSVIDLSDFYTKSEIDAALAGKQPLLTWDNVPISGSSNAISSGAIYTALDKIKIEEISDIEYDALVTKDPDKVYFVYEAEEDNRTIIVKNNNGDFVYSASIYGVVTNGTPGWDKFATDSDAPTTPPTKAAPQMSGTSLIFSYTTAEKTVYFNRFRNYAPNAGGRAIDSDASNCYFTISGTDNNQYSIVTAFDTLFGPFVALSTGDYVEFATVPKPNGFKRIYKGDELYATNEKPNANDISYDNTNSGLTAANVQAAIDELNTNDVGKKEYVNDELKGEIFNAYSGNTKNVASGDRSHAEGLGTTAEGSESHAEGLHTTASGNQSHAEGNVTKANGGASHAEGDNTTANGGTSHAEGYGTITKGQSSHAEGFYAITVRNHSHAEGDNTVAVGVASHTEGVGTKALEQASHAGGYYTKSAKKYETVIGKYNLPFEDTDLIVSELIDNSYYLLTIPVYKIYYYNSYTLSATSIAIPNELKEHLPSSVGDYGIPYVICDNNKVETELWGCLRATAAGEEKTVSISMLPSYQNYLKNYNSSNLYIKVYADTTQLIDAYWKKTTETTPDSLFVIGNGRDGGRRSNIVEVDTTSLNVNGDIKQNGVTLNLSDETIAMTDVEYIHLASIDPNKTYLVQETRPDKRTAIAYDSNNNALYKMELYGCVASAAWEDNVTTAPELIEPDDEARGYYAFKTTIYGDGGGTRYHADNLVTGPSGSSDVTLTNSSAQVSDSTGSTAWFYIHTNNTYLNFMKDTGNSWVSNIKLKGYSNVAKWEYERIPTGMNKIYKNNVLYSYDIGKREYVSGELRGEVFNVAGPEEDKQNGHWHENTATGFYSHAEGYNTTAAGTASHAEGSSATARGERSHAEGNETTVLGSANEGHAEGAKTIVSGSQGHAEGYATQVYAQAGHAEGKYTIVGSAVVDPETGETTYTGTGATFGHAEGYTSHAAGYTSHAEGYGTLAAGVDSHAEGYATQATGDGSHAEGYNTRAAGGNSHAEGHTTVAQGLNSHAGGSHTQANTEASTVIGKYNVADGTGENDPKHLFIVGNGVDNNNRSNILEVSDTYLNVNGDIKQNGVIVTPTPHTELTQAQYDALQNPDAGTEYFITDASSGVTISALESRLAALEMQETVYYINGVQRVPLYSQNITKVVKIDDNTVDWYFLEPTSQKTYKARVTAQGEGNTRTNPLIIVTEVSS